MEGNHSRTQHPSFAQIPEWINHPSHPFPGHSLRLLQRPIYPNGLFTCNGCWQLGHGLSYHCTQCNFDLHFLCVLNSEVEGNHNHAQHPLFSQMPQLISHPSHPLPGHSLTLRPRPRYPNGLFTCNGCRQLGHGFNYGCIKCNFDLHFLCALNREMEGDYNQTQNRLITQMPQLINHPSHLVPGHSLSLRTRPTYPNGFFTCNGCRQPGHGVSYNCAQCNYDLHFLCALDPPGPVALQPQTWSPMTNYSFPRPCHPNQATGPSQSGTFSLRKFFQGLLAGASAANSLNLNFLQSLGNPDSVLDFLLGFIN